MPSTESISTWPTRKYLIRIFASRIAKPSVQNLGVLDMDGGPPEAAHEFDRPGTGRQGYAPRRLQGFLTLRGLVRYFTLLKQKV